MFRYLPEQASEIAPHVDWIHNVVTDLSVFFTVAIVGAMLYFAVRYRRKDGVDHETPRIEGSHTLEVIWTVVPTIICIFIAYYGIEIYREMRVEPKDPITINVTGQKWFWNFEYDNGKKLSGQGIEWVVPVDKPVKLIMQSTDVLHSFFIPAMRVKKDVIPGQYTWLSFKPIKTGDYPVFCTEYCGKDHSAMLASLKVVSQGEYERWVNDRSAELAMAQMSPAERGRQLYTAKGCNACHSLDGTKVIGPTFLKSWGTEIEFESGEKSVFDENYVRESVLYPTKQIHKGFLGVMPSFAGQLSDDEITALSAFIKSVDGSQPEPAPAAVEENKDDADWGTLTPVQRGERWYKDRAVPGCVTCHSLDGSKLVGPSFKGIWGREQELADGSKIEVNEAYIIESLMNPMAKVVKDYPPSMPPYQGQLSESDIKEIIEYLKTIN